MGVNVGRSAKMALARNNKTVLWLSQQLGVSHNRASTICNTASGNKKSIDRLADLFGMTAAEFIALGESDPAPLNEKTKE